MSTRFIVLLVAAVFSGSALVADGSRSASLVTPEPQRCPSWFEESPKLGPGRPEAVQLEGLSKVTVCRYLHAFSGSEVVHDPPLQSNVASEAILHNIVGVKSLARSVDRLEPFRHPKMEQRYCGVTVSGGFYLLFLYRDGHRESVNLVVTGCRHASAGKHGKLLHVTNELKRRLGEIAPPAGKAGSSRG